MIASPSMVPSGGNTRSIHFVTLCAYEILLNNIIIMIILLQVLSVVTKNNNEKFTLDAVCDIMLMCNITDIIYISNIYGNINDIIIIIIIAIFVHI